MSAANKKRPKANRKSLRAPVVPAEIKGLIIRGQNGNAQAPFLIWDVSMTGIGIWSSERLKTGERVKLTVGQPFPLQIDCRVIWCDEKSSYEGFRCGLVALEESAQLKEIYEQFSDPVDEDDSDDE